MPRSFNDIANCMIKPSLIVKKYITFKNLIGSYQNYTCADLGNLKKIGYSNKFTKLEIGIKKYINHLNKA